MAMAGVDAARDNERKYALVKIMGQENRNEKSVIMGDRMVTSGYYERK